MAPRIAHSRRKLFGLLTLTLLVITLAADSRADEPEAPADRAAVINAALGRPITCDLKQTPLAEVVRYLEDILGVTIALDSKSLDEVGIGSDTQVTLRLTGISAASTLRLMLRQIDPTLTFFVTDGALLITTDEVAEENLDTRFYDVADLAEGFEDRAIFHASQSNNPFLADGDFDAVVELITYAIEPVSWDEVGGPGSIGVRDGIMVVSQTREVHEEIQLVLTALRKARAAYKASSTDLSPIALSPIMQIQAEKAFSKLLDGKGLNLSFKETPLGDVVEALSEATKKTVLLDVKSLDEVGIGADTPVTFQLKGLTLREEIRWILRPLDLTYRVWDEALIITTPEAAEENLQTLLHPVWDLVGDSPSGDYDSLIELMTSSIEPDSWDEVGGPGSIAAFTQSGCLVVSQTREVQEKIQDILARLRAIEKKRNASVQPAADDDPYVVVLYQLKPSLQQPPRAADANVLLGTAEGFKAESPAVAERERLKVTDDVMPLIQQLVEAASWSAEEVVMRPLGKNLVVRQRVSVQRRIVALLQSLELMEDDAYPF